MCHSNLFYFFHPKSNIFSIMLSITGWSMLLTNTYLRVSHYLLVLCNTDPPHTMLPFHIEEITDWLTDCSGCPMLSLANHKQANFELNSTGFISLNNSQLEFQVQKRNSSLQFIRVTWRYSTYGLIFYQLFLGTIFHLKPEDMCCLHKLHFSSSVDFPCHLV